MLVKTAAYNVITETATIARVDTIGLLLGASTTGSTLVSLTLDMFA